MGRPRTGFIEEVNGQLQARLTYTDSSGKRHDLRRRVQTRTQGYAVLEQLKREAREAQVSDESMDTFARLADWYEKKYAVEAEYREGHKIAGLRDKRVTLQRLGLLKSYFGARKLRIFTYGQIEQYKLDRLRQTGRTGDPIKLATVHRELALLRRLFNLAVRERWIPTNPFNDGSPLIIKAHEAKRKRVMEFGEEKALLEACTDARAHLVPIIICAADTGMRQGEIFQLRWTSVRLSERLMIVQKETTKTLTQRVVPISSRLLRELELLRTVQPAPEDRVFGIEKSVSKGWKTACEKAEIEDLRFHDLRHTFSSRLSNAGVNPFTVAILMGHATPPTHPELAMTFRYTHFTEKTLGEVITVLDSFYRHKPKTHSDTE